MSEKTGSNQANAESRSSRTIVIAVAVVVLVAGLASAMFFYQRDGAESLDAGTAAREAALASEHSPTLGNADAKVHIVEFLDPACETCALFYPMVKQWMTEVQGQIRLSIRHVAFHPGADHAVRVLEASRKQDKYWQTLETLLATQREWTQNHRVLPEKIAPAIASVGLDMEQLAVDMNAMDVLMRIEQDRKDAIFLKVSATPGYFVNGRPLPSFGRQQLANLVREELEK